MGGSGGRNGSQRAQSFDLTAGADPNKDRSAHIKNLVADRMREEEIRNKLVAEQIVAMKR